MTRRTMPVVILVLALAVAASAAGGNGRQGVVNINTATAQQLELLPRVGPSLAARIIAFRKANGPFKKVDELVAVKGIGERSLANLAAYTTVSGATTLTEKVRLPRRPKASAATAH